VCARSNCRVCNKANMYFAHTHTCTLYTWRTCMCDRVETLSFCGKSLYETCEYPIYIYVCVCVYICVYMCVCVCVYMYIYVYIYIYMYMYIYIYYDMYICMCVFLCVRVYCWATLYICLCMYVCVHKYICIHIEGLGFRGWATRCVCGFVFQRTVSMSVSTSMYVCMYV